MVYVLILPGFGTNRVLFRSKSTVSDSFDFCGLLFAMFLIACLGSSVWGHHLSMLRQLFFQLCYDDYRCVCGHKSVYLSAVTGLLQHILLCHVFKLLL